MKKEKSLEEENEIYELKKKRDCLKASSSLSTKFYFWDWCLPYGWRQMGNMSGYDSIEDLKKDNSFSINGTLDKKYPGSENWKILKAEVIESKNIN